jgi:hypothetical protein
MRLTVLLMVLSAMPVSLARAQPADANALTEMLESQQKMLQQQQQMLLQMQAKIADLEAKQAAKPAVAEPNIAGLEHKVAALQEQQAQTQRQQVAINNKVDMVANKEPNLPKGIEWVKNVKISGDFRYRFERIDAEGYHNNTRDRIRVRLGLEAKVADDVDAGFRIATDQVVSGKTYGDPVSTNQTQGNGFGKDAIWLDLAYFNWHPKDIPGLNVIGGKMVNPFFTVGGNQLIWDSDLTPEGVAAKYITSLTDSDKFFVNGGGFWASQNGGAAYATTEVPSVGLWGIQGGVTHTFEDKSALTGGAGYFTYGNIQGSGPLVGSSFFGNSNSGGNNPVYTNEYGIAELFGEYDFNLGDTPAAVFADYANNTQATSSGDEAWLVGASYGKCTDPGTWQLQYDYREVDADAVVGAFNDSDFIGGGTNGKGHRFGAAYQLTKNVQGVLNYFLDKRGSNDADYNRLEADLNFKF